MESIKSYLLQEDSSHFSISTMLSSHSIFVIGQFDAVSQFIYSERATKNRRDIVRNYKVDKSKASEYIMNTVLIWCEIKDKWEP